MESEHFFVSEDGSVRVAYFAREKKSSGNTNEQSEKIDRGIKEYKWRDDDFLLTTYPKNGTHLMWEIMTMLIRGSADYIKESKVVCMFFLFPITECDKVFPSPRVLNTHLRLDVLPREFQGRKTVCVLRNPKDTAVSYYQHRTVAAPKIFPSTEEIQKFANMPFNDFLNTFLHVKNQPYGSYFDYAEYMWSLRDQPHILIIYFEDIKRNPVSTIQKINEFLGTDRSPVLVQEIAYATNFSKMKAGKSASMDTLRKVLIDPSAPKGCAELLFRKGEIGDWKNRFTVAENELFDSVLANWTAGKEIPFTYE